jgi:tRNA pseudouridine55 synthase
VRSIQQQHGVLFLDKPFGLSSNQALSKIKRLFQSKKAGHTGCLDPYATGLLPVCLGEATKFAQYLLDAHKTYEATVQLGITTTTGDREGDVLETRAVECTLPEITVALAHFKGASTQIPPMYSALKHQGKPLYAWAREGVILERASRNIEVFFLELISHEGSQFKIKVSVSKGTYIRTLVEDIGQWLGCGAHLYDLRRTEVGGLNTMHPLSYWEALSFEERVKNLQPMDSLVNTWPKLILTSIDCRALGSGQKVQLSDAFSGWHCLYTQQKTFVGIGYLDKGFISKRRVLSGCAQHEPLFMGE